MELAQKAGRLKILGPASLIYAVFFTFCLYDNLSGITVPFAAAGTLVYFWHVSGIRKNEIFAGARHHADRIFLPLAMLLLGISSCLTDSSPIIVMNAAGGFILLLVYMLRIYYPDVKWNVGRQLLSMLQAVFGAVGCMFTPFTDLAAKGGAENMQKQTFADGMNPNTFADGMNPNKVADGMRPGQAADGICPDGAAAPSGRGRFIFLGILITVPILITVLLLLASADAVFSNVLHRTLDWLYVPQDLPGILFMAVFAFFASYCGIAYLGKRKMKTDAGAGSAEPLPFVIVSAAVLMVYIIFSAVQVFYLFLQKGSLPEGMTYADYAHQGFYQLLVVCIFNMILVVACTERLRDSALLKGLLAGISACTYVMIASAAYRMVLYIGAYDMTFLRLFVLFALAVMALLMAGVTVCIFRPGFPLFRYELAVVTVLYLAFSFAHPDCWVARYNIAAANEDFIYLKELSADSVPAFAGNEELMEQADRKLFYLESMGSDFRKFNFSRAEAERILKSRQGSKQEPDQELDENLIKNPESALYIFED